MITDVRSQSYSQSIPAVVLASPLMARGGFDVFDGLLDDHLFLAMVEEAFGQGSVAREQVTPDSEQQHDRGGCPARQLTSAPGGPVQDAFYHAPWVRRFLSEWAGAPMAPTGDRGTYSYYIRPGDGLALHRDIYTCDLSVLSLLYEETPPRGPLGCLRLYPGRRTESLTSILRTPEWGAVDVSLKPGLTAILFGGLIPHLVSPIAPGQVRVLSVLCYRFQVCEGEARCA